MTEIILYKGICHVLLYIPSNLGVLKYSTLQILNLLFLKNIPLVEQWFLI